MSDVNNLAWLDGYRQRVEGKPRPSAGHKRQGWDAADRTLRDRSGGYGQPQTTTSIPPTSLGQG